ncbi:uncharacterized protein Dwil_GK11416 [Drosophila willistoni]|uniref:Uncharacterized protein n=1 Tax=Drosophila willistoni TaxID=7260 RepID=B4NA77_DROWI|nr:uncharacterized protein LOC6647523 [Drosophila willistoni]EDW80720.1 uncharacterized protein Dwil_GK11416 [Drosophila willistoni]
MANDGEKHLQAAYEQLIEDSVKAQFEKNGTIGKMQSELHVKVLQMLKGQLALNPNVTLCGASGQGSNEGLVGVLNQLIIEYFNWYGYKHTMETFKMESGVSLATRSDLEAHFSNTHDVKQLPILLQILMREQERDKKTLKIKQLPSMKPTQANQEQILTQTKNSSTTLTKVIRNMPGKPLPKTSVVKQLKPLPVSGSKVLQLKKPSNKENQKYSSDLDSEATDYKSSTDDDLFSDIPDRHYYREEEPPERKYPLGFGEEGPYRSKQKEAERLYQKYQKQTTPPLKSKTLSDKRSKTTRLTKTTNAPGREALEFQLSKAMNAKAKSSSQTTSNSGKCLWSKQRTPPSEIEPNLAVMKPKCPDTLISKIQLDSDEDNDA